MISEGTRRRVREAAERLGYRPDPALSALVSYRTKVKREGTGRSLVFLHEQRKQPGQADSMALRGVRRQAEALGYQIARFTTAESPEIDRLARVLAARGVAGMVLGRIERSETLRFPWERFPVVSLTQPFFRPPCHLVRPNLHRTARTAMAMVREHGFRRPGLIVHDSLLSEHDALEIAGYLVGQLQFEAKDRIPWLQVSNDATSYGDFQRWLKAHEPDVVIAHVPALVITWLERLSIRIPEELPFLSLSHWSTSPSFLAGFDMAMETTGEVAVRVLDSHIRHSIFGMPEEGPLSTLVSAVWRPGKSYPFEFPFGQETLHAAHYPVTPAVPPRP